MSLTTPGPEITITNSRIYWNEVNAVDGFGGGGGGLSVNGGLVTVSTTLISDNVVLGVGAVGANVLPLTGQLYYKLPLPPGYWLPNAACNANREPCPDDSTEDCKECEVTRNKCAVTAGSSADSWRPSVSVGCAVNQQCMPPIFVQPCDWQTAACTAETDECLLGQKISFIQFEPIETTFPNPCVPARPDCPACPPLFGPEHSLP